MEKNSKIIIGALIVFILILLGTVMFLIINLKNEKTSLSQEQEVQENIKKEAILLLILSYFL